MLENILYFCYSYKHRVKEKAMTERAVLLNEIEKLPPKYFREVINFVEYLRQKTQKEYGNDAEVYKEMAADTEREQEAQEWCSAYFGPVCS